jgi:hypothetical protein
VIPADDDDVRHAVHELGSREYAGSVSGSTP